MNSRMPPMKRFVGPVAVLVTGALILFVWQLVNARYNSITSYYAYEAKPGLIWSTGGVCPGLVTRPNNITGMVRIMYRGPEPAWWRKRTWMKIHDLQIFDQDGHKIYQKSAPGASGISQYSGERGPAEGGYAIGFNVCPPGKAPQLEKDRSWVRMVFTLQCVDHGDHSKVYDQIQLDTICRTNQ